jgi:hypothetical protein
MLSDRHVSSGMLSYWSKRGWMLSDWCMSSGMLSYWSKRGWILSHWGMTCWGSGDRCVSGRTACSHNRCMACRSSSYGRMACRSSSYGCMACRSSSYGCMSGGTLSNWGVACRRICDMRV